MNFLNSQGKITGEIKGVEINGKIERAYVSRRKPLHYFVKYSGFGLDIDIRKNVAAEKIEYVMIIYEGKLGRKVFLSLIDDWYDCGEVEFVNGEGGSYGKQAVLPISRMRLMNG